MKEKAGVFLRELNTVQIEEIIAQGVPLFLPVGTLEAHGRHLPVGTDTICAESVSVELARRFDGAVAPSVEYGITKVLAQTSPASFFPEEIFENFVETILRNFHLQGFAKIILVNGHGGNRECLKRIARRTIRSFPVALTVINWWLISENFVESAFNTLPGGHAAVEETALIQHFRPDLVISQNYDCASDTYVPHEGMWMYPPPGEIILHKENQGLPDFDRKKCAIFVESLINDLEKRLQNWLNSLSRIKGGLRP